MSSDNPGSPKPHLRGGLDDSGFDYVPICRYVQHAKLDGALRLYDITTLNVLTTPPLLHVQHKTIKNGNKKQHYIKHYGYCNIFLNSPCLGCHLYLEPPGHCF
jgi:hypothetical protein